MDTKIRGLKLNSIICDDYLVDGRLITMTQEQYMDKYQPRNPKELHEKGDNPPNSIST